MTKNQKENGKEKEREGKTSNLYLRRMQIMRWIAFLLALAVIIACFYPWVLYPGGGRVEGFYSDNRVWGRPGLIHTALCSIYLLLLLFNKMWSLRLAFFVSMINIAWAIRNFFLLGACEAGICPEKQTALYVVFFGSLLTTIALLFHKPKLKDITGKA